MTTILTTVDTIHKFVPNIPEDSSAIQQVCGYVTEVGNQGDIKWTQADWDRFPAYVKRTIAQLPQNDPSADILDVETGAATDPTAVSWIKMRHMQQLPAHIYVDAANVDALYSAVAAAGELANTYLWLADWNLDEAEATALLGTKYKGFPVDAVQWASPSSNPNTPLPGSQFTLRETSCDLSVSHPFSGWQASAVHLVSVVSVATFSDGHKESWTVH